MAETKISPACSAGLKVCPRPRVRLTVLVRRLVVHYLDELHHATVLVSEDVAVVHKLAGEIGEPGTELDIAGSVSVLGQGDREGVPPDPGCWQDEKPRRWELHLTPNAKLRAVERQYAAKGSSRIKHLKDLEGIYVDMKGMQRITAKGC